MWKSSKFLLTYPERDNLTLATLSDCIAKTFLVHCSYFRGAVVAREKYTTPAAGSAWHYHVYLEFLTEKRFSNAELDALSGGIHGHYKIVSKTSQRVLAYVTKDDCYEIIDGYQLADMTGEIKSGIIKYGCKHLLDRVDARMNSRVRHNWKTSKPVSVKK